MHTGTHSAYTVFSFSLFPLILTDWGYARAPAPGARGRAVPSTRFRRERRFAAGRDGVGCMFSHGRELAGCFLFTSVGGCFVCGCSALCFFAGFFCLFLRALGFKARFPAGVPLLQGCSLPGRILFRFPDRDGFSLRCPLLLCLPRFSFQPPFRKWRQVSTTGRI